MMLLFRISVQLSVEPLATTTSTLEHLPVYFYIISGRIQLDCFDRSVYSQYALFNKTWLKVRKAFCLLKQ